MLRILFFLTVFIVCNSFAQDDYGSENFLIRKKDSKPTFSKHNSIGVILVPYVGMGFGYNYRAKKGWGVQTSVLEGWEDYVSFELSGLYTLFVGDFPRIYFSDRKDYTVFVYQGNHLRFNSNNKLTTHSIGLGFEMVYWKRLSNVLKAGGAYYDSFDRFGVTMEYGIFYKF